MSIRVMVADDIDIIRENISEYISQDEDIEIVGLAATGEQVIDLAKNNEVDVILMDIEMENNISGIYAAEVILNTKPDIKIVFMSVHEEDRVVIRAMETGAVDYLIKTDDKEKIINHVKNAYNNNSKFEHDVQVKITNEMKRLRKSEVALIYFIKKIAVLTPAEKELIKYLLAEKKLNEIAKIRCVELVTIKTQVHSLLKKFNVHRTKEIVRMIKEMNLEYLFL